MGYRSDVIIKCEKNMYKELMNYLKVEDFLPDSITAKNNIYCLTWEAVKWGDDIDDILTSHDETEEGYGYHFIRLGEDYTDIEELCNSYNTDLEMYIIRQVDACDAEYWEEVDF